MTQFFLIQKDALCNILYLAEITSLYLKYLISIINISGAECLLKIHLLILHSISVTLLEEPARLLS